MHFLGEIAENLFKSEGYGASKWFDSLAVFKWITNLSWNVLTFKWFYDFIKPCATIYKQMETLSALKINIVDVVLSELQIDEFSVGFSIQHFSILYYLSRPLITVWLE